MPDGISCAAVCRCAAAHVDTMLRKARAFMLIFRLSAVAPHTSASSTWAAGGRLQASTRLGALCAACEGVSALWSVMWSTCTGRADARDAWSAAWARPTYYSPSTGSSATAATNDRCALVMLACSALARLCARRRASAAGGAAHLEPCAGLDLNFQRPRMDHKHAKMASACQMTGACRVAARACPWITRIAPLQGPE